ncbi:MAG: glutamate--tRNA ligase [Oscillospiraceae bacterium]|nr:glutamate--tRNA ligase [Oscillospiraceae bacterium]
MDFFEELDARIPRGKVRTRFAPSPTGYMHVGNLRTALYTWLIARNAGGTFILRIEDTDQGRLVDGAVDVIYKTLAECGLTHNEGPDVGGPVGPYVQTERRGLYGKYAALLVEKGMAYRCFCDKEDVAETEVADGVAIHKYDGRCSRLLAAEIQAKLDAGLPYVVRQKIPQTGSTTFHDASFGDITVDNSTLDDQILLKRDGLPTYNFANVVDDHLMGITHVVRGSEYLSSAPKYNLLYEAFGWEIPTYVHCSPVMRDAQHKMSKRHGDPSYEDLIAQGFLTEAVLNYVALLGWSPKGEQSEQEFFTLEELAKTFDISGISKSPAVFDLEKLRWMNSEYMKRLPPEVFFAKAEPWLRQALHRESLDLSAVAALVQPRCEVLSDLPERVNFLEALPDYDPALYTHKKSKSTPETALQALQAVLPVLERQDAWSNEALYEALLTVVGQLGVKNSVVLWPIRVAVSGKQSTPGGATELCALLGKEESLARIRDGIARLSQS